MIDPTKEASAKVPPPECCKGYGFRRHNWSKGTWVALTKEAATETYEPFQLRPCPKCGATLEKPRHGL